MDQRSGRLLIFVRTGIGIHAFSTEGSLQGVDLCGSFRRFDNHIDLPHSDELAPDQNNQPGGRSEESGEIQESHDLKDPAESLF